MALPALEKTWQFDVNQVLTTAGVDKDNQQLLLMIKESFIGFASGQWTVTSSSDGSVADLTDNWAVYTDLVFATTTSPHAWLVLTNSATGAQLCIDCNVSLTSSELTPIYFSPGGGYATTGLVVTARPTPPADEIGVTTSGGSTVLWSGKVHVMMSTDGETTRVVVCRAGKAAGIWIIDKVRSPITGWTNPNMIAIGGSGSVSGYLTYAYWNDAAKAKGYITTEFIMYLTSEAYGSQMLGEATAGVGADSQTGGWLMCPIGLASITVNHVGRKGSLYDIWWGSITRVTGDTYPNDTSYQFAQFGDMILPWNGTLPLTT